MKMRTLGQKRARYALEEVLRLPEEVTKDFKSFSASAPSMILQNGFGQSMAFWLAKGTDKDLKPKENDKHILLFDIIKKWLSLNEGDVQNDFMKPTETRSEFIKQLSDLDQGAYLDAQRETLALLEWVKRFASAEIKQGG